MKINHIKASELHTNLWSGGTTTQLYIYPEDADYKQLNFEFRISTAKVELESSNFTSLPGISRQLMILDGSIHIKHKNHHQKQLYKFDLDTFEGDWKTSSRGTCIDFNLMCNKGTTGDINANKLNSNSKLPFKLNCSTKFYCFYVFKGSVAFLDLILETGDILVLSQHDDKHIEFISQQYSELIITNLY